MHLLISAWQELYKDEAKTAMPPLTRRETPPSTASADSKSSRSTASPQSVSLEGSLTADQRPHSAGKGPLKFSQPKDTNQKASDAKTVDRLVVHGLQETAIDGDDCKYFGLGLALKNKGYLEHRDTSVRTLSLTHLHVVAMHAQPNSAQANFNMLFWNTPLTSEL